MKVASAHHPIIEKEVDELLSKGAIEPSSGGACFYSNVFHMPVLDDILDLVCSKQAGKRTDSFLCSLLVPLGLHINFPSLTLTLLVPFVSWDYVEILSICQYLYLLLS